jgi:hypothetical protein
VATLIQRVEEEAGPIDVLVNNAGIDAVGGLCEAPPDELRRVTEVNYLAPAELCRQVIPRMLERGGGHIVNVSSGADCMVIPGLVTYSASKARCPISRRGCEPISAGCRSARLSWKSDRHLPTCSRTPRITSRRRDPSSGLTDCGSRSGSPRQGCRGGRQGGAEGPTARTGPQAHGRIPSGGRSASASGGDLADRHSAPSEVVEPSPA